METEELVERPVSAQDQLSCVSAPLKCRSGGGGIPFVMSATLECIDADRMELNGMCPADVQRSTGCARKAVFRGLMLRHNWNSAGAL